MDDALRFDLLGPLRAHRGPQELELGPARQQAVLAALLVSANHAVPVSEIVDQVWGDDPPANGANVVQKYVAGLRRVLEPDRTPRAAAQLLTLTPTGYRLTVAVGGSDLDEFTAGVQQARDLRALGRTTEAVEAIRGALALWRSTPLAGLSSGYFDAVRAQLADSRADALEEWAELELLLDHEQTLLPELTRLITEYPARQRLRAAYLTALYRTGRRAEALTSYHEALQLSGGRPSPELQAVHKRILQGTPAPVDGVAEPVRWTSPEMRPPLTRSGLLLKVTAALVPWLSCGAGGGLLLGVLAIRRRSWWLGLAAVGYLVAISVGIWFLDGPEGEDLRPGEWLVVFAWLLLVALCSLQLAIIVPERAVRPGPLLKIDLNSAPLEVLRTLPGVPPEHAALIIAERNHGGPFGSLQDVATRGVFPWPLPRPIADVVLVVPVQDAPKEEHR
ncbi:winged helix-turn-helix domain-containing protein [Kribbella sp. NBC_01505]|uniref:BTAD domain-containing putative transcriptional regulator n=1 Tax=Kribbella sp. NBC_01505 TaxID=2903580 RepID=UPI00386D1BC6